MPFNILQNFNELLKGGIEKFGVNKQEIDSQVEQDIQQKTNISLQEFYQKLDNLQAKNPSVSDADIMRRGLQLASSRGYTIDGKNVYEAAGVPKPVIDTRELIKPKAPTFGGALLGAVTPQIAKPGIRDIAAGMVGGGTEAVFNVLGVGADILTPEESEGLGDELREFGLQTKEDVANAFASDPEGFGTKFGQILGKYGLALTPTPIGKVTAVQKGLNILGTIPKVGNIVRSAAIGATQVGQFEAIAEGEVTSTGLITGAVLGPVFDKVTKFLAGPTGKEITKKISERFGKLATKLAPSKAKKDILDLNINKGTQGAFTIREMNPDIILKGDDAIANVLEASKSTRSQIYKEIADVRGSGIIKPTPIIKWIDDVVDVLKNPSKLKQFSFDRQFVKQFKALDNIENTDDVIRNLLQEKRNILSKGERTFSQWDDLIVSRNKKLSNFFNQSTSDKTSSEVSAAVADRMKHYLDDSIGALGDTFRKLKQSYGNVRVFEDNLNKIYAQVLRRKDSTLGDFADTFILSNMGANIASGNFGGLGKDVLAKLIKEKIKKQNDPNFVLGQMFDLIDKSLKISPTGIKAGIKRGVGTGAAKTREVFKDVSGFNKAGAAKSATVKNQLKQNIKNDANVGYHGTNKQFDVFLDEAIGKGASAKYGKGVYLSSSPDVAKTYADSLSGLYGGKARLLEVVIPKNMKIKSYDGPLKDLRKVADKAKVEGYQGIKFNTDKDYIRIPGRTLDTTGHHNYLIFNSSDAKIIKNYAIKELGPVKGLGLLRDLLAGGVVGLNLLKGGLMLKDKFFPGESSETFRTVVK